MDQTSAVATPLGVLELTWLARRGRDHILLLVIQPAIICKICLVQSSKDSLAPQNLVPRFPHHPEILFKRERDGDSGPWYLASDQWRIRLVSILTSL